MRGRDWIPHSALKNYNRIPGGRSEVQVIKLMECLSKGTRKVKRS